MDKTIGYYIEKYLGVTLGVLISLCLFFHWYDGSVILTEKYYDIIIKLSASIFGFLLTILALVVNSSSKAVVLVREHKNYPRLIKSNRAAVFLLFLIIILSVVLYLIIAPINGVLDFVSRFDYITLKILICMHSILCIWSVIDSAIFIRVFYKIILFNNSQED